MTLALVIQGFQVLGPGGCFPLLTQSEPGFDKN